MDFSAIDVETANADMGSICQIGIARFQNGVIVDEWKTYVDPEDYFDAVNISIHGIDESTVDGAPTLTDISSKVRELLDGRVSVCHTHFDRVAIQRAFDKYNLRCPSCRWLDSARVARRAWKEFERRGYGLANVCEFLGYEFAHHDALEDAKAAGHILIAAAAKTELDISGWLDRVEKPIRAGHASSESITREGNPEGPLYGEVVVFTGSLQLARNEAAEIAAQIGCRVARGVTTGTTILVVGDQDVRRLAGHPKSSKHRKAEALISKGNAIRIIRETDFQKLVKLAHSGSSER